MGSSGSILQMQNLERKGAEFEPRKVLIIISCGLKHIKKRGMDYRLHTLLGAVISLHTLAPWLYRRRHRFCGATEQLDGIAFDIPGISTYCTIRIRTFHGIVTQNDCSSCQFKCERGGLIRHIQSSS